LGFTYLDPAQFHEYFAADLSAEQAAFMARSQAFGAADNFKAVYHDSGVEKQTELDVSSDEKSNHQSGLTRQSRCLRLQAEGDRSSDQRSDIPPSVKDEPRNTE
jgi:hypothetical protein